MSYPLPPVRLVVRLQPHHERASRVERLRAGPADRPAHALHIDLGSQPDLRAGEPLRQHEGREARAAREGMPRVEPTAHPDVLVSYHASFDRDLQIKAFGMGWGPIAGRSGTARVEEITVGTLAIDIVNASTRALVWRAMASKDLDPNAKPEKRDKNIDKAAQKLFQTYPPVR